MSFQIREGRTGTSRCIRKKNLMSLYNEIMCMEEDLTKIFAELGTDG